MRDVSDLLEALSGGCIAVIAVWMVAQRESLICARRSVKVCIDGEPERFEGIQDIWMDHGVVLRLIEHASLSQHYKYGFYC